MTWLNNLPDWLKFVLILVIFFVIYIVYMYVRYSTVKKKVLAFQDSLKPGDEVMTQSGLYGVLQSIGKNTAELKIADNLIIVIDRFSIKNVI